MREVTKGLDAFNYCTMASLASDNVFRRSGQRVALITPKNGGKKLYDYVQNSLKGGLAHVFTPYAEANNPYVPDYNPRHPTSFALATDVNSLYPKAMTFSLPTGEVKELEPSRALLDQILASDLPDDGDVGYLLCVTWHCNKWDSPFPPIAKRVIDPSELSEEQRRRGVKPSKGPVLVPHFLGEVDVMFDARRLKDLVQHEGLSWTRCTASTARGRSPGSRSASRSWRRRRPRPRATRRSRTRASSA